MEIPTDISGLIASFHEEHAVMRLVFDGDSVRDLLDVHYLSPDRYRVFLNSRDVPSKGPVFSRNSLKRYVIERIRQGEEDDYDVPFDALRISIGKVPKTCTLGNWSLDEELWCMLLNVDLTDDSDVERINIRLDVWLDIFEESWV